MYIGIFTNNYLPNPYGVSTSIEGFRKGLESEGHKVSIFAPSWHDEIYKDLPNVYRYHSLKVPTKVSFSLAIPYSQRIDKKIKKMPLDLIHAQHPNLVGAQGKRWAKEKKIPLIYTWHSIYDKYVHYVSPIPQKFAAKWIIDSAIKFAQSADYVIVPSKSMYEIVCKKGLKHKNIHVIPSGVDEELFSNPNGDKIKSRYNIPLDALLIVSISRVTEEKNVSFLAKVMRKVLLRDRNAYFLFGGDGDLLDEVKNILSDDLICERVIFAGKIDREAVKDYLDSANIFVYASTTETQGTIISEAMYMGIPIVAVNASGVRDLIDDGKTGYLTKENISDMTYAILKCINNVNDRKKIGAQAKNYAMENYTVKVCTQKLIDIYERAIFEYKQ